MSESKHHANESRVPEQPQAEPVMQLPDRPDLKHLRKQAKRRLESLRRIDPSARLADAQYVLACDYGFRSWRSLQAYVDSGGPQSDKSNETTRSTEAIFKRDKLESTESIDDELQGQWQGAFSPFGNISLVEKLLDEHPTLVNARPWPGYDFSPLEATAGRCVGHRPDEHRLARILMARGAQYDLPTAARCGVFEAVVASLAEEPARINLPDRRGRTALYRAACVYGDFPEATRVVSLLLERGAKFDLYSASALGQIDVVKSILTKDDSAAANQPDPDGCFALHWSVRPRVRWAESCGLPRDAYPEITRMLLDAGADPSAKNAQEQEMQPLHHIGEWPGTESQAQMLLDAGANINAASQTGWSSLDYANDRNRKGIAKTLQKLGGTSLR